MYYPVEVSSLKNQCFSREYNSSSVDRDKYHLLYITKGEADIVYDGVENTIQAQQLFIIHPDKCFSIHPKNKVRNIWIEFNVLNLNLKNRLLACPNKPAIDVSLIHPIIMNMINDATVKRNLYKDIINVAMSGILLLILSSNTDSKKETSCGTLAPIYHYNKGSLDTVLNYIELHYAQTISLKTLSSLINVSPEHLCTIFKAQLGVSPIQYINNVRITKAKELMFCSDLNITEIAQNVGFNTVHYFCRFFKEKEHISPLQFRSSMSSNIILKRDVTNESKIAMQS